MSILKKSTLALALVAGLSLAGSAFAVDTGTGPTAAPGDDVPQMIATGDVFNASTAIGLTDETYVTINATDNIIGRTQGFGMRLALSNGAAFDNLTTNIDDNATPGDTSDDTQIGNLRLSPAMFAAGWRVTVAAGNGTGLVTLQVTPPEGNSFGVPPGTLIFLTGGESVLLDNLIALQTQDQQVDMTASFFDSGTTLPILTESTTPLMKSGDPVSFTCQTGEYGQGDGPTDRRIDVAEADGDEPKTHFSRDGLLGDDHSTLFNFGQVEASIVSGFTTFDYQGTDEFHVVMTGEEGSNFNAFDTIWLSQNSHCYVSPEDPDLVGVISGNTVTFDFTGNDVPWGTNAGSVLYICGEVDGVTVIDDVKTITATGTFTRPGTDVTHTQGCATGLNPLLYNGSVIEVYHINPAANPTAQTFLRVINRSGTGGWVRVEGIDDAGVSGDSEVRFYLEAGHSVQFNSDDLEAGNLGKGLEGAWGNGTGKWRAIVTAEFGGARVQAMSRNTVDDTVTNLTDADGQGEQTVTGFFDNGFGF
jgi:hypothetical protein